MPIDMAELKAALEADQQAAEAILAVLLRAAQPERPPVDRDSRGSGHGDSA